MQSDDLSIPGLEVARRLGRLTPAGQRELSAIERLRSWDGRIDPDSVAGLDLPGVPAAPGAGGRAGGDRRPRPGRALARPRRQRLHRRTSPRPGAGTPICSALWEEGDEELIGRPWDELVLEALSGGPRRPQRPLRPRSRGLAVGPHPRDGVPAPPRRRQPDAAAAPEPPPPGGRRPGDGEPDRLRPQRPLPRGLGAELADGRRPDRRPSAHAGRCSPASRAIRPAPTTTTSRPTGSRVGPSRWPARARGASSSSRRPAR